MRKSMILQSVLFEKEYFTKKQAKSFAKRNKLVHSAIDTKKNHYRMRQVDPKYFNRTSFRTKEIDDGVKIIVGKLNQKGLKEFGE